MYQRPLLDQETGHKRLPGPWSYLHLLGFSPHFAVERFLPD